MKDTPDEKKVFDQALGRITKAGMPTLADMQTMGDLLSHGTLCRVLCAILRESDNKLTFVGTGNLSDEKAIKDLIKVQGEAIGLSRAVEYIIEFSLATKENENETV